MKDNHKIIEINIALLQSLAYRTAMLSPKFRQ